MSFFPYRNDQTWNDATWYAAVSQLTRGVGLGEVIIALKLPTHPPTQIEHIMKLYCIILS